jgi:hypothetical protein
VELKGGKQMKSYSDSESDSLREDEYVYFSSKRGGREVDYIVLIAGHLPRSLISFSECGYIYLISYILTASQ